MNLIKVNAVVGTNGQQPVLPKSVFVTGANGFIGRVIMARYQAMGVEVRGMDLRPDLQRNVIEGNLTRPEEWAAHAQDCELFINTAAVVSLVAPWQDYRDITVQGTRNAIDVAIAAGAKRFLQFSSVAAMGWQFPDQADEKLPVIIGSDYRYGVAKGASEHVVLAAHASGEIDATIVRPGDVYGPGSRAWITVPFELCREGKMILPAHGKGIFSPVYIDDLLDGMILAAGLDAGRGQIFILTGDSSVSCMAFFSNHQRWAGKTKELRTVSTRTGIFMTRAIQKLNQLLARNEEVGPDAMYMFARTGGYSIEKAKRLLGYQPKVSLEEGLRLSEVWLRETGQLKWKDAQAK